MLKLSEVTQYVADEVADDGAIAQDELERIVALALVDYARLRPYVVEEALATVAGTLEYALPAGALEVLRLVTAEGADVDYAVRNASLRLAADPQGATYTLTTAQTYAADAAGDYPAIPAHHLDHVGDLAYARCLDRLADDIARRPETVSASTREAWNNSPRTLMRAAGIRRGRVRDALGDDVAYAG